MAVPRTTALTRRKRKRRRGAEPPPWAALLAPAGRSRTARVLGGAAKPPAWKAVLAPPRPGRAARVLRGARRSPWKVLGLAGIAGVAATGVVVARNRRTPSRLAPDELRERLHARLAQVGTGGTAGDSPAGPPV